MSQQLDLIGEMAQATSTGAEAPQLDGDTVLLSGQPLRSSLPVDYLRSILLRYQGNRSVTELQLEHTQLADILAERARGQHEMGWFISGLSLKLGLLGTVIGFVMMLGSVTTMESLDLSDIQGVLSRMTLGMGVALNTTLVGLTANVLLGFQYLMLDRGADKLVSNTVHYAQTSVIPRLATDT
jgi:biopolymer transport protein ExbB/TolQ